VKTPRHYDTHGDKKFLSVYPFARLLKLQAVLEPKSSSCVGRGKPAASLKKVGAIHAAMQLGAKISQTQPPTSKPMVNLEWDCS
jgi:hypothetical protein